MKRLILLLCAMAVLVFTLPAAGARADSWIPAGDNYALMRELAEQLDHTLDNPPTLDEKAVENIMDQIRAASEDDYFIAKAILDHWYGTVLGRYRYFTYRGEDEAETLKRSGLEFSPKHAFVVLGYQLQDGEMTEELIGRCEAAAAAARAFPDSILITTGGATGSNNPNNNTEAEKMKDFLVRIRRIDSGRIYTDKEAMSTVDNAVNAFRIMKRQGITSYTVITSNYHQVRSQILFNAVAAAYELKTGYRAELVGNYNYTAVDEFSHAKVCRTGLNQLLILLKRGIKISP